MNKQPIKIGIVGISGYSGGKVLDILLNHPGARVTYVSANNTQGRVDAIWPHLHGQTRLVCRKFDLNKSIENADLFFLAVPHTVSMTLTPLLLQQGKKVIDLSGDYRLDNVAEYKKWYGTAHKDRSHLASAVYGLPELFREKIKKADLIANPGCYPTAALLAATPYVTSYAKNILSIVIDAKSGVSGAGKKLSAQLMFTEVNESFKAYKVLRHQHSPEIDLYLSRVARGPIKVNFVPHLLPIQHGIFETIYVHLKEKASLGKIYSIYKKFYKTEHFVRLLPQGELPEIKHVLGTNYCNIGLSINTARDLLVITSAIDNLWKGAAGQAVQNMNIMCGFPEKEGLI